MSEVLHEHHALYLSPVWTLRAAFSRPVYYIEGVDRGHSRERCAWHCDDKTGALHVWRNTYINTWEETIPYDAITGVTGARLQQGAIGEFFLGKQEAVTITYEDRGRTRQLVLAGKIGQLEKIRREVSARVDRAR